MLSRWLGARFRWRELILLWRGRDQTVFRALWTTLQDAGIDLERTHLRGYEACPPAYSASAYFQPPLLHIRVRLDDAGRARQIVRATLEHSSLSSNHAA